MQQIDLFAPIREVLSSPEKWTKGRYARDDRGVTCSAHSSGARCWCIVGATMRAHPGIGRDDPFVQCVREMRRRIGDDEITDFNDRVTFEDIQRLLAEPFYGPSDAAP
jgi:hypothetical protein